MELVLNNGFCNLSMDEMNLVNAGGWREFDMHWEEHC